MRNWLLPEKFEDILPPQAQRIDRMRAKLLELFRVHGYQLVIPPMLEYLESLLTGTGHDLDLRTFKLVDQLSGRMMGVRADIAPQVARTRLDPGAFADRRRNLRTPRNRERSGDPGASRRLARRMRYFRGAPRCRPRRRVPRDLPARRGRCRARGGIVRSA